MGLLQKQPSSRLCGADQVVDLYTHAQSRVDGKSGALQVLEIGGECTECEGVHDVHEFLGDEIQSLSCRGTRLVPGNGDVASSGDSDHALPRHGGATIIDATERECTALGAGVQRRQRGWRGSGREQQCDVWVGVSDEAGGRLVYV